MFPVEFGKLPFGSSSNQPIGFGSLLTLSGSFVSNSRNGVFQSNWPFVSRFTGSIGKSGSFGSTLTFTQTWGTVPIVGHFGSSLALSGSFNSNGTFNRTFQSSIGWAQRFGTIPIIGSFGSTLTLSQAYQPTYVYERSFVTRVTFTGAFHASGDNSATFSSQLNLNGRDVGYRVINASFGNTLGLLSQFSRYVYGGFGNTLALTSSDIGVNWKNRNWSSQITFANSFNARVDPSRTFTSLLKLTSRFSGFRVSSNLVLKFGDLTLTLPNPLLGNRRKSVVSLNRKIALTGVTYTYVKRSLNRSYLFDFNTDLYMKTVVKDFFDNTFDEQINLIWNGEQALVYLTSNPIVFDQVTRSRMNFSLSFEGQSLTTGPPLC